MRMWIAAFLTLSAAAMAQTPPVEKVSGLQLQPHHPGHRPLRCDGIGAESKPVSWNPRHDGLCYDADNPYVKYGHH